MSLGGRLGAYVLDLETGRSSSWSSNAEFDATPVAGPMLIAAVQWAIAEGKLQGTGRYSTCPAAGVFHRAALDDLCSSMASAPDPATTAALHKILADRQLLSGFLRHLDGGRKEPEPATAGVISCAAELSVAATPRDIVESLKYVFSMVGNGSAHHLLRQNARMGSSTGTGLRSGVPGAWPVFCQTSVTQDGKAASVAAVFPPSRAPLLMSFFIAGSNHGSLILNDHLAELARIVTTNLLLPSLDPYPDD